MARVHLGALVQALDEAQANMLILNPHREIMRDAAVTIVALAKELQKVQHALATYQTVLDPALVPMDQPREEPYAPEV